jgi:hypothetical protein
MKMNRQKAILYAAALGMEGCWLYTLLALLNGQVAGGRLSDPMVLAVYPLAFAFNFMLGRWHWPRVLRWTLSWLAWAMVMLVIVKVQLAGGLAWSDTAWLLAVPRSIAEVIYTFRPELLILLVTAAMWWLGRRLSRLDVNFGLLLSEFQFGLAMLVAILFIASELHAATANPIPVAMTFFLFALIGISVAHALEGTSWLSGLYQGHWSGLLLVSIAVILALGLVISLIVTPDFLHTLAAAARWIWGLFWGLVDKILSLIAGLFPSSGPPELPPVPTLPPVEPEQEFHFALPVWLRSGLRLTWAIFMIGFLLFALWRISSNIFRWLRRRLAGTAGAEFESIPGAFRLDIFGLFRRLLRGLLALRLLFRPKRLAEAVPPEIGSVRQIYRQLLRWAAAAGYPRFIWQTPQEYCGTLVGLLPEAADDLHLVTQFYVRARYGARASTTDQMDKLSQAWHRVKQAGLKRTTNGHDKEVNSGERR